MPTPMTLVMVAGDDNAHVLDSVDDVDDSVDTGVRVVESSRTEVCVTCRVDVVVPVLVLVSVSRVLKERSDALQPHAELTTTVVVTVCGSISPSEGSAAQASLPGGTSPLVAAASLPSRPSTEGTDREKKAAIASSLIIIGCAT